jgi:hypothetical protein
VAASAERLTEAEQHEHASEQRRQQAEHEQRGLARLATESCPPICARRHWLGRSR